MFEFTHSDRVLVSAGVKAAGLLENPHVDMLKSGASSVKSGSDVLGINFYDNK